MIDSPNAVGTTALVVEASRTAGLALTGELLRRGWNVVATVRNHHIAALRQLKKPPGRRLAIVL
jgi:NAD(P)-dependent dehydrogenase (short-subunit alcohol dehydrogenase family)